MSCCSGGHCKFQFEDGAPLLDNSVTSLSANYLFLPYGTLLEEGEVVRIWMESGEAKVVVLEEKILLDITDSGPKSIDDHLDLPWQLIALDSGIEYEELMNWKNHPLYNPEEASVLLRFNHPIEVKPSLKMWFLSLVYKLRNL